MPTASSAPVMSMLLLVLLRRGQKRRPDPFSHIHVGVSKDARGKAHVPTTPGAHAGHGVSCDARCLPFIQTSRHCSDLAPYQLAHRIELGGVLGNKCRFKDVL